MEHIYIPSVGDVMIGVEYVAHYDLVSEQHYHHGYELYYLCEGERTYIVGDKIFACRAKDVALIKPNVLHGTSGSRYSRYVVNFGEEFLRAFFSPAAIKQLTACFSENTVVPLPEGEKLFADMLSDYRAEDFSMLALRLGETLLRLQKNAERRRTEVSAQVHPKIAEIVGYLGSRYAEIESIDELAERFYFSKYYLCRIFKKYAGVPPGTYLLNLRMANASRMLTGTDRSVSEIAEKCGFRSVTHFCNTFKKHVGISPSAFRKKTKPDA